MIEPKDFIRVEMVNTKTPEEKRKSEKKRKKIDKWKGRGIICDDWNGLYERVEKATQCELCPKVFSSTFDRQVDHDHFILDAPNVRNIVCNKCNHQKSDRKIKNNTGERHIYKIFRNVSNKYYYHVRISRDGKLNYCTSSVSLEKAIIKRDQFIKKNPSIYK